ncbi:STAS domain-containing protein [Nonomuraea harbinensis]|uniref:STAS domain-containing protein n=1 Tax=Nonomuraea harbinensis TaxID=1286938 RepID=A0ABW1BLM0_9ACTN|nr:STAS domain-containing protein [Nonomuraea harbinensis]
MMSDDMGRLLYEDAQLRIIARSGSDAVLLVGEVDVTNSSALERTLRSAWHGGEPLTVDTGALTFVDLSGLRVLVMPAVPPGRRWIRLVNVTPFQRRLMGLMGWHHEARAQPLV